MKNKVSIIVPIYNQDKYLHISIPKIMNQSYQNIEIVLVNDGSTDNSLSIIQHYQNVDSRVVVVDKKNGGLVDATISGIYNATGEFICFVDPDDDIGEDFVKNFIEEIEDYDFVAMGIYFVRNNEINNHFLKEDRVYTQTELRSYQDKFLFEKSIINLSNRFFHSRVNKMYRSSLIKVLINKFKECTEISLGEDTIFTYLLLGLAQTGKTCTRCNSYYYNMGNPASMTNNLSIETHINKAKKTYLYLSKQLKENGQKQDLALASYLNLISPIFSKGNEKKVNTILSNDLIYRKCIKKMPTKNRLKSIIKLIYFAKLKKFVADFD